MLDIREAAVHFGGVKAVDGVTLHLGAGKIYGLLGPNGSGKSTLLAAVSGLVELTRGSIAHVGHTARRHTAADIARAGVARTFQTVRLLSDLTVFDNVLLGADHADRHRPGVPDDRMRRWFHGARGNRQAAAAALERVGLAGAERLRPHQLPYGAQRRVEIARAIAMRPALLLLDEPVAGMNRQERTEISDVLLKLREEGQGLTQLLVEHDVQMITDTCDHVFVMNFGVLIAEGAPDHVVRNTAVREAYLGKRWEQHADG
ncbi:ABC transporter ATP-binding protein [Streptomyces chartreusis]|uniref:ABC transporter ATP-binding protein n=1 Tax=Streptomyces chartreusis TaxID=1969 RepID=UPI0036FD57EB